MIMVFSFAYAKLMLTLVITRNETEGTLGLKNVIVMEQ